MPKAPHHRGTYHRRSRLLVAQANADPTTTCWRCGKTMSEVRIDHPRAKWTAGHVVDGQVDGLLLPEDSWCNYSNGAKLRHQPTHRSTTW